MWNKKKVVKQNLVEDGKKLKKKCAFHNNGVKALQLISFANFQLYPIVQKRKKYSILSKI